MAIRSALSLSSYSLQKSFFVSSIILLRWSTWLLDSLASLVIPLRMVSMASRNSLVAAFLSVVLLQRSLDVS